MKIWIKNLYFAMAILTFLISSSFFIFTALGYNYNFLKNKIEKTSVLYIKSYPKNSQIFLNNKKYKKNTPTYISHLKPNSYTITIQKNEYQKWKKHFLIKPEETIFIEDVSLFYKKPKLSILKNGNFESLSTSPNKQDLLFYDLENKELNIYNLLEKKIITIEKNIKKIQKNLWSPDNQKILLKINNQYYLSFVYFNKELLNINQYLNLTIKNPVWDKFNSNYIYFFDNNQIYKFNIEKKSLENIKIKNILAIKPEKEKLFYIQKNKNQDTLKMFNFDNNKYNKIIDLKNSTHYKFISAYNDYFCLLNSENTLYLIDPNTKKIIKKFYNINDAQWDFYNRILLLRNDFEIWTYDLKTGNEILINRFSKKIENAFWHKNNNHIFYTIDNKTYVIELDNRDGNNIYNLKNINNSNKIYLANKKGNILYYISSSGLVKNIIQ